MYWRLQEHVPMYIALILYSLDCQYFKLLCRGAEGFLFALNCYSVLNRRLSNFFCKVDRKHQRGLFLMSFFLPCVLLIPSNITGKKMLI